LKQSELERGKARARSAALKEKLTELESLLNQEKEETTKSKRSAAQADSLRSSLAKKDVALKATKAQLEKV